MRAGLYAEFEGTVCRAVGASDPIRLYALTEPAPAGFEPDRDGRWTLLVHPDRLTRLFDVETTATWGGQTVNVTSVRDGIATFTYFGMGLVATPDVQRVQSDEWSGAVSVDELSDVIEVEHDLPL